MTKTAPEIKEIIAARAFVIISPLTNIKIKKFIIFLYREYFSHKEKLTSKSTIKTKNEPSAFLCT